MNKSFYNIDDVSQIVGEQKHTIRFWEKEFKQIKPKVLIVTDYYYYNKKKFETTHIVSQILENISSIENIIVIPYEKERANLKVEFEYIEWNTIQKSKNKNEKLCTNFKHNKKI